MQRFESTMDYKRLATVFSACRIREDDEALTIDDLIVLMVCIEMSRREGGIGERITLSLNECCRYLHMAKGGRNTLRIEKSLKRLHQGFVEEGMAGAQHRFLSEHRVETNVQSHGIHVIRVAPWVASIFVNDVSIDVVGMAQHTAYLARWLWWFYSLYPGKGGVAVRDLYKMSGAKGPLFKFRAKLRQAMDHLMLGKTVRTTGLGVRKVPPFFAQGATITKDDKVLVVLKRDFPKDVLRFGPGILVDADLGRLKQVTSSNDQATPFTTRRRVFVVTTSSAVSDGFIDFQSRLARFGNTLDGVVRMKPAKRDQDNTRHLAGAILKLIDKHNPGRNDIVAIVRGGGPDEQFTMFDAEVSIDAILALRNRGVYVIAGVGHTRHTWAIDAHVNHAAAVPFAAAEYVNALLEKAKHRPTIERRIFPTRAPVQRHPALA